MYFKTKDTTNKIAILLLCLVVVELILQSNNQVESVKSLKKKIYLKKLKKILPILAILKPKKKILLLPIPFPMFKKDGMNQRPMPGPNMMMMMRPAGNQMMMLEPPQPQQMMMLEPFNTTYEMMSTPAIGPPSMTMTISSVDSGSMPSIELNTNMMTPTTTTTTGSAMRPAAYPQPAMSAPLIYGPPKRLISKPVMSGVQYVEPAAYHYELINTNGRDCCQYRSQAASGFKRPSLSPARLFRSERFQTKTSARQQQQPESVQGPVIIATPATPAIKQAPLVTINNHNYPRAPAKLVASSPSPQQPPQQQPVEQLLEQHVEMEDLVSIGPPQLIPIYQTRNGRLHMTPPPSQSSITTSSIATSSDADATFDDEVRLHNSSPDVSTTSNLKQLSTKSPILNAPRTKSP